MTRLENLIASARTGKTVSERLQILNHSVIHDSSVSDKRELDAYLNELYRLLLHADLHDPDQQTTTHELCRELTEVGDLLKP